MRYTNRRWLYGAGAMAVILVAACGQAAIAHGAQSARTAGDARHAVAVSASAGRPAAYVPPGKPLHFGEKGPAVKSVQRRLSQLHYYPGAIDGVYGDDTLEAAWAFREVQGLRVRLSNAAEPIDMAFLKALVNPRQPAALVPRGGADRVEVNQSIQVLVLYRDNQPFLIAHVSSGGRYYYPCPGDPTATCGPAITPDGNYHALSFAAGWVKVPLGTMYNPVFFIGSAYAIHGDIPVPWYPASHGCVRIWMDIAPWFHKDLRIGGPHPTPIYIRGTAPAYPKSN
jgi:Putative peptidoglycan binding domain/L,D-transpeptidase catalytic domain